MRRIHSKTILLNSNIKLRSAELAKKCALKTADSAKWGNALQTNLAIYITLKNCQQIKTDENARRTLNHTPSTC